MGLKKVGFAGVSLAAFIFSAAPATAQVASAPAAPSGTAAPAKPAVKPQYRNVRAFYRNVRAFWGDVNPFYRNVRAFWGDVDPFYRNVRAFWGDIDPAARAASAGIANYDGTQYFWDNAGYQWESLASKWQTAGTYSASTQGKYSAIAGEMRSLVATAESYWGSAVQKQTKKSFKVAFSDPFLARWGLNLNDPASFAKLSPIDQSQMFVEWYDGLMNYSGTDHADWWMKSVNWTPKLSQTVSAGNKSVIGLVDDYGAKSIDLVTKVKDLSKKTPSTSGHGEGVLSLIASAHDGKGIMGIAPDADVVGYNPFNNGSAEWSDVSTAIQAVAAKGASVINLSLGEPGKALSPEWKAIFTKPEISARKDTTLYVIAAGNDGVTQTGTVDMQGALDSTFIVVGSVGPTGISEFSNRPGTTCITNGSTCKNSSALNESGLLMNRFIVAPGELILVSDGAGGVVRQSGTSLAAPLVSGTVALVQARWPWMKDKPRDIAKVILGSATDMGAPGVDPVYGVGMLNVEGAMSPLDFSKLRYYLTSKNGKTQTEMSTATLRGGGIQASWSAADMYFTAFEKLDQGERDFLIPLSSRLYGTKQKGDYFQDYVYNRMVKWVGGKSFAGGRHGFAEGIQSAPVEMGGWKMQVSGRMVTDYDSAGRTYRPQLRSTVDVTSASGALGFKAGYGDGAVALGGGRSLALAADLDPYTGGTNPLLGFASGGAHAAVRYAISDKLDVQAGFTEQQHRVDDMARAASQGGNAVGRYRANAMSVSVGYDATSWLRVTGAATSLREPGAILGVQPLVGNDMAGGSRTRSVTFGADADLGSGIALFGSATAAQANSPRTDSSLRIGDGGIHGTAFQLGVAKHGLVGNGDALRLTVARPLGLDGGSIELTELQVIDRNTGETGVVTQRFSLAGTQPRRLVVEGSYSAAILNQRAQFSLFGRGELRDLDAGTPRLMVGSQFQLAF